MNAFELMMDERHLDQRIGVEAFILIDKAFELGHERPDDFWILRRRVDDTAVARLERSARELAKSCCVLLECRLDLEDVIVRQQPGSADSFESDAERPPVVSNFFASGATRFWKGGLAKQLIVGRHDVLNC